MKKYDKDEVINMALNHPVRLYFSPIRALSWSGIKKSGRLFVKAFTSFVGSLLLFLESLALALFFILSLVFYPITRLVIIIKTRKNLIKRRKSVDNQGYIWYNRCRK